MSRKHYIPIVLVLIFSSCSTFKYSSRVAQTQIAKSTSITPSVVDVNIDFSKKIKATSDRMVGEEAAKQNAYYKAIIDNNIDILVSPVYEIIMESTKPGAKGIAKVTGYAGYFNNPRTQTEQKNNEVNTKITALGDLLKIEPIVNQKCTTVIVSGSRNVASIPGTTTDKLNLVEQFELLYNDKLAEATQSNSSSIAVATPAENTVPKKSSPYAAFQQPTTKSYKHKSPFLTGMSSLLIPGLGQYSNGQKTKGLVMTGIHLASYGMFLIGASNPREYTMWDSYTRSYYTEYTNDNPLMFIGMGVCLLNGIVSAIDAATNTKRLNIAHNSIGLSLPMKNGMQFNLSPDININYLSFQKTMPVFGAKLSLDFN